MNNLQADLAWYTARGLIPAELDAAALVDHQYVEYALQRLGPQ